MTIIAERLGTILDRVVESHISGVLSVEISIQKNTRSIEEDLEAMKLVGMKKFERIVTDQACSRGCNPQIGQNVFEVVMVLAGRPRVLQHCAQRRCAMIRAENPVGR